MVAFEDHFWGEKNAGFDVLYHNMKYGNNASCKLVEFIRERSTVEETYAKALLKLGKSATPVTQLGTFEPLWGVLRVATEKLANAHFQVVQRFQDLIKDLKEYGEKQKEKHKQAKEDFSSTLEIVQMIQTMTANLVKSKETYYARCQELDRFKKDGSSAKDIEKAETKTKKAEDDYRHLVEKREIIRNDFHDKMVVTSKKFQKIDEEHLKIIIFYLEKYIDSQKSGQVLVEQVYGEFLGQVRALTVDHLLDQFVRSKGTGKAIPGVITFEEFTGQVESTITNENSPSLHAKPASAFPLTLKRREKKEKKKKVRKEKAQNGPVDSPSSEGGDHSSSFEVDEEGYTIRHDSHSENAKSGGNSSSSDSDSDDDDEPCRLQVVINPVGVDKAPQTASVDEIKKISGTLSLSSPSSSRRNLASSSGEGFRSRARSTGNSNIKLSRSSDDLLDIDFSQTSLPSSSESSMSGLQRNSHLFSQNGLPPISSTDTEHRTQSSGDLRSLPSVMQSSPSLDSSESIEGDNEVVPVLPAKKGSMSLSSLSGELSDIPPPLPVKQGTSSETKATFPADFSFVGASDTESTSSEMGITFAAREKSKAAPADSSSNSSSVPFIKPPPTSEIPRSASVSSALPRPRPQQRSSATALFVPSQITKPASTTSYSAELFSYLADYTPTTTTTVNAQNAESNVLSSESRTVSTSSTSFAMVASGTNNTVSKPPVVSYLGSTAGMQTLNRATTTSALEGTQENVPSLVRSKTVGGMPTMLSVVFAKGAAGTVSGRKDDTIPIAVAFIESVNALFRGSDQTKCMVKVTGDITVSFPASVLPLIFDVERAPMLSFLVRGTSSLEQLLPNKALIISEGQLSSGDGVSYKFNMASLADHLKKQSEQGASSYYNIDIIKYEVKTSGFLTTPLQLCSYWKCEEDSTDLRLDYRYNPSCMSAPCSIANMSVLVPVTGGVSIMQSKPSATWSAEHQRALWKLQEISSSSETQGSLRAKFDLTQGPGTPSRIAVQFTCNGATISKLNFELKTQEYKLSLVKKKFATGKYTAES